MSKGILVLDEMPQYCAECPFCYEKYHEGSWCDLLNEQVYQWGRSEHCPLRELPAIRENFNNYDDYLNGVDDGWNDCLYEILGEEEICL